MNTGILGAAALAFALGAAATAQAEEVTLRAASNFATGTTFSKPYEAFVARVNETGKGIVQIQAVGGPEAVPPFELGNALSTGVIDVAKRALGQVGRRRLSLLTDLFGAALSLVLCWASAQALGMSFARRAVTRGVLDIPEWLLLAAPVVGSALLAAEFLRRALRRRGGELGLVGL